MAERLSNDMLKRHSVALSDTNSLSRFELFQPVLISFPEQRSETVSAGAQLKPVFVRLQAGILSVLQKT